MSNEMTVTEIFNSDIFNWKLTPLASKLNLDRVMTSIAEEVEAPGSGLGNEKYLLVENSIEAPYIGTVSKTTWSDNGRNFASYQLNWSQNNADRFSVALLQSKTDGVLVGGVLSIESKKQPGASNQHDELYRLNYSLLYKGAEKIESTTFSYKDAGTTFSLVEQRTTTKDFWNGFQTVDREVIRIDSYRFNSPEHDFKLSVSGSIVSESEVESGLPVSARVEFKNVIFENSDYKSTTPYVIKNLNINDYYNFTFEPDVYGEDEGELGVIRTYFDFIDPVITRDAINTIQIKNVDGLLVNAGDGADKIYGNVGDDTLDGGGGRDLLAGGAGNDAYVLSAFSGTDTITDSGGENDVLVWIADTDGYTDNFSSAPELYVSGSDLVVSNFGSSAGTSAFVKNFATTGKIEWLSFEDWRGGLNSQQLFSIEAATTSQATRPTVDISEPDDITATPSLANGPHRLDLLPPTSGTGNVTFNRGVTGSDDEREWMVGANSSNDFLLGGLGSDVLSAGSGRDFLSGGSGDDYIFSGAGTDTLVGGAGDDTYLVNFSSGSFSRSPISTANVATATHERIYDSQGSNSIELWRSSDPKEFFEVLQLSTTTNGASTNWWCIRSFDPTAGISAGAYHTVGTIGTGVNDASIDKVSIVSELRDGERESRTYSVVLSPSVSSRISTEDELVVGTAGADSIDGGDGDDLLQGGDGNDALQGGAGDDLLYGGNGINSLVGGLGDDYYQILGGTDTISENADEGWDSVQVFSGTSFTLGNNLEGLYLGGRVLSGFGNALNNSIYGNEFNNVIDGSVGIDTMEGGKGNDTYRVDNQSDVVIESNSQHGYDTVITSVSYSLDGPYRLVERLQAQAQNGSALTISVNLQGNFLNNHIAGGSGNDTLIGGAGNDTLVGGVGNDTYVVGFTGAGRLEDVVTESSTIVTEIDTVQLSGSSTNTIAVALSLTNTLANIENIDASGTGSSLLNLTGNSAANAITGNAAANNLDGGLGNDTLAGGAGNDTLVGGAGADSLTGGFGMDTFVFASGASGQTTGFDTINDYSKGARFTGDLIDYSTDLVRASASPSASATRASVNQTTGVATFASGSGTTLGDALADCAAATTAAGQFALFQVDGGGDYYVFISDGTAGVTANDVVVKLTGVTSVTSIDLTGGNLTIL